MRLFRFMRCKSCWLLIVAILSILGYIVSQQIHEVPPFFDSADLKVMPGVGIPDVCEVGMTVKEMRKQVGDLYTFALGNRWVPWNHWKSGSIVVMPSLGAEFFYDHSGPILHITFRVKPFQHSGIERLKIEKPFRGGLQGYNLSFGNGDVTREQVLAALGNLPVCNSDLDYAKRWRAGESISWVGKDGYSVLWYNHLGICFTIKDYAVVQFEIFPPRKAGISNDTEAVREHLDQEY